MDFTSPTVDLGNPNSDEVYTNKKIPVEVSLSEQADTIYYSTNGGEKWKILETDEMQVTKSLSFEEGFNTLMIKAADYAGNEGFASVTFEVETDKPKIKETLPEDEEYGNGEFSVEYDEYNTDKVDLFWRVNGTTEPFNQEALIDCPRGKGVVCLKQVNLDGYDEQAIEYYFTVADKINTVTSKKAIIILDLTVPQLNLISPINGMTYNKTRQYLTLTLSEQVDELTYVLNDKPEKTVCSNCNSYNRIKYFSRGTNNFILTATDYAGNTVSQAITFYVIT